MSGTADVLGPVSEGGGATLSLAWRETPGTARRVLATDRVMAHVHPELLKHRVRILVVGCGGNGSAVAAGLPYFHQALLAYGHPEGVHVTLLDPENDLSDKLCAPAFQPI